MDLPTRSDLCATPWSSSFRNGPSSLRVTASLGEQGRRAPGSLIQVKPTQPKFFSFQRVPRTLQASEFVCRSENSRPLRLKTLPSFHERHDMILSALPE